jgi:putative restriction endonuclease
MAYGVFIHRPDSDYNDTLTKRYQFPAIYLNTAQKLIGNWIVYFEPRRVPQARGYFGMAKVEKIVPDPTHEKMYLALIQQGSYLHFVNSVPFNDGTGPMERGLLNEHGKLKGLKQSSVRTLTTEDFNRILEHGFEEQDLPRLGERLEDQSVPGMAEGQAPFIFDETRTRVEQITTRAVRDRMFRSKIIKAYDKKCAITGLQLINGGGRAEVEAAHIKPVKDNGPDIISNGIALSGTVHWMFDRGLIGLKDDYEILVSRHVNDPSSIQSLINKSGKAIVPQRQSDRPHPTFLAWHRDNCFKA